MNTDNRLNFFSVSILFFLIFGIINFAYGFNICNVDISEPWFVVNDSTGIDVLIIDSEGDMFFQGTDHTQNNKNAFESIEIGTAYFNNVTSQYGVINQNLSSLPILTNSFIINNSHFNTEVAGIDENGNIYTKSFVVSQGENANCLPDGNYCNGNILESRDYFCDIIGIKSGVCDHNVLSSEDCLTKLSTDTDGGVNFMTQGTVRDYIDCSSGNCIFNSYTDFCPTSENLVEYANSGASYTSQNKNCNDYNYNYCSGLNVRHKDYGCGSGSCGEVSDTYVQTCLSGSTTYSSWVCSGYLSRTRIETNRPPVCSSGSCSVNIVNTNQVESAPAGFYCSGGSWLPITYYWSTGTWGTCSVSCGGGTQFRSVTCRRNYDNAVMSDSYCGGVKPVTSQVCNTQGCYEWRQINGHCLMRNPTFSSYSRYVSYSCYNPLSGTYIADSFCTPAKPGGYYAVCTPLPYEIQISGGPSGSGAYSCGSCPVGYITVGGSKKSRFCIVPAGYFCDASEYDDDDNRYENFYGSVYPGGNYCYCDDRSGGDPYWYRAKFRKIS